MSVVIFFQIILSKYFFERKSRISIEISKNFQRDFLRSRFFENLKSRSISKLLSSFRDFSRFEIFRESRIEIDLEPKVRSLYRRPWQRRQSTPVLWPSSATRVTIWGQVNRTQFIRTQKLLFKQKLFFKHC